MKTEIARWLYATFAADATLTALVGTRIYADIVPQGAAFPCVLFSQQASTDNNAITGEPITSDAMYQVKAIATDNGYQAIEERIHTLIHNKSGETTNAGILRCIRQEEIQYPEVSEGVTYFHSGGLYLIMAEAKR